MDARIPFIIINDSTAVVDTLKKIIERAVPSSPIKCFNDGLDGWEYIVKDTMTNVILCDTELPTLGGLQILKNTKSSETLRKNYMIMVTSDNDKEVNIKAMQQGADDFLKKPFSVDELIGKIRTATRIVSMQVQVEKSNRQVIELQEDLNGKAKELKNILTYIIKERIQDSEEQLKRIKEMALWVAEEIGENDAVFISTLEEVCELCYCGKLFLSDGLISTAVTSNGNAKNEKMERIPAFTKQLIGNVKGFERIFSILYLVYENYDGSGMPDKKQSRQIPIASRIMRAVLDFEEYFMMKKYSNDKIVELMTKESKRIYDPKVLTLLDQFQAYKSSKAKIALERAVNRKDLAEGMMLSRQIVTESGTKIMGSGTYLTQEFVDKIISITKNDPAIGKIYIKN